MRRSFVVGLFCILFVIFANTAFAQNTQIGGTVQDVSKALVPGVTITLLNTGTGVTSNQVTNEDGVYTFPSVPAGNYSVTASLPGFKTSVQTGIQVTLAPVKVNFTLEVGQLDSKVEVIASADAVLSETAASVGVVLPQRVVTDLPLVGQNVLSLLDVLPGFRAAPADSQSTIGGLNLDYTNTTIDGLSTVSSRDSASLWGRQVLTTNVINPGSRRRNPADLVSSRRRTRPRQLADTDPDPFRDKQIHGCRSLERPEHCAEREYLGE